MENGGNVNTLEGDLYSKVLMNRNRGTEFVDRAYAMGQYPSQFGTQQEDFNSYATHLMQYGEDDNGQYYMSPSIFNSNNDAIKVPNQYADYISKTGYKNETGLGKKKNGGLFKAQNGLNTLPIDNTRVNKVIKLNQKIGYDNPIPLDKRDFYNKSSGRIEESMSPLDVIPMGVLNTSSKLLNNAWKLYSNYNKIGDVINAAELYSDVDKLPSSRQQFITTVKKNGGNINSQWEVMEEGGDVITDPQGQWKHPGKITRIPGNNMATHGYGNIPLYVVPDVGKPEIVYPNTGNHNFPKAKNFIEYPLMKKGGEMIKRADGTYSKRGLWDNIRANAGSGKKPTKEMLKQEKKIKTSEKKENGGSVWKTASNSKWEIIN
jgi:hypothetical protein